MNYKVLCSDLDGTLLSTKNDVSDITMKEIDRISDSMQIILVSARMPSGMYYLQERLGITEEPIICYNGALIMQGTTKVFSVTIPSKIVEEVYRLSSVLHIALGIYVDHEWYVPETSERVEKEIRYTKTRPNFQPTETSLSNLKQRGAHKIMLMCTKESADKLMQQLITLLGTKLNIYRSNDTLIELAPKSVSKRSAIEEILLPKLSIKDVIAFGDNYNDIEMLRAAGCGVAVANARDEVKAIADHITLANTAHGVADFIQRHLVI